MKKRLVILLFLAIYLFSAIPAFADSSNFSTSYDVTYNVLDDGSTKVVFLIELTNTTERYFATSYSIKLGFDNIYNIYASDAIDEIKTQINKESDGYKIDLDFNKKVVGKGNKQNFNLSFITSDVVQKQGKIWEVNIPGVFNQNDFNDFNVHVRVPKFLGAPTYIKPFQQASKLDFNKEELGKSGVSLAFGESQIYSFSLTYHLKNKNLFPIQTEIAIPPTTNYQDISIDTILPRPLNVKVDKDANWLAEYSLKPSEKKDVIVKGKVQINLYPKIQKNKKSELIKYLNQKPYWEISNKEIQKLAKELKTPRAIYDFVVKTLTYDFSRVTKNSPRIGALGLMKNPDSAVCLEFTDLFVAIARAAGIPAREIDGFAYTQNSSQRPLSVNSDILHAWPEFYDFEKDTWIMVDPTWGNTTGGVDYFNVLDFDHFAFVIKGLDSEYPIPAGGYKQKGDENKKDVLVEFASDFTQNKPKVDIATNLPKSVFAAFPINGTMTIVNTSSVIVPKGEVMISSDFLSPSSYKISYENIPPFGYVELPINFKETPFLTNLNTNIKISFSNQEFNYNLYVYPIFMDKFLMLGGGILASFVIILSLVAKMRWRLSILRQKE